jgi:hypothetical protein
MYCSCNNGECIALLLRSIGRDCESDRPTEEAEAAMCNQRVRRAIVARGPMRRRVYASINGVIATRDVKCAATTLM